MTGWLCRYAFLAGPPSFRPSVLVVFSGHGERAAAVTAVVTLKLLELVTEEVG